MIQPRIVAKKWNSPSLFLDANGRSNDVLDSLVLASNGLSDYQFFLGVQGACKRWMALPFLFFFGVSGVLQGCYMLPLETVEGAIGVPLLFESGIFEVFTLNCTRNNLFLMSMQFGGVVFLLDLLWILLQTFWVLFETSRLD